jgi:hypothetical protein
MTTAQAIPLGVLYERDETAWLEAMSELIRLGRLEPRRGCRLRRSRWRARIPLTNCCLPTCSLSDSEPAVSHSHSRNVAHYVGNGSARAMDGSDGKGSDKARGARGFAFPL